MDAALIVVMVSKLESPLHVITDLACSQ